VQRGRRTKFAAAAALSQLQAICVSVSHTHSTRLPTREELFLGARGTGRAAQRTTHPTKQRTTQKFMDFGARALPRSRRAGGCARSCGALSQSYSAARRAKGGERVSGWRILFASRCWAPGRAFLMYALSRGVCLVAQRELKLRNGQREREG